jgi:hypothetical protein
MFKAYQYEWMNDDKAFMGLTLVNVKDCPKGLQKN